MKNENRYINPSNIVEIEIIKNSHPLTCDIFLTDGRKVNALLSKELEELIRRNDYKLGKFG